MKLPAAFLLTFIVLQTLSPSQSRWISKERVRRSDDVLPVETVVNRLTEQVNTYEARLDALEAKVAKTQTSVAFHAEFSRDPVNLSPAAPIVLDRAVTNIGNGYDANNGNFRAPVSGTYMFVVNFMGDLHIYMYINIMVDNNIMDSSISHGDGNTWDHVSESLILHLNAGQLVWLQRGSEQNFVKAMRGGHWTTFSGFLINADP